MDNLFEYLIYLFLIISFLSSLFKKKEKPQPPQQTNKPDYSGYKVETSREVDQSTEVEDYNKIMREIENLFKTGKPEPEIVNIPPKSTQSQTEIERKEQSQAASHYKENWHRKEESEHQKTMSEHILSEASFQDKWEKQKERMQIRSKEIESSLGRKAAEFEKNLDKKIEINLFAKNLREKFRNPTNLKEFIIMSEILRKPKSLQR